LLKQRIKKRLRPLDQWARKHLKLWVKRYKLKVLLQDRHPLRIVVGASSFYQRGWVPTEMATLNLLNLQDWRRYFAPSSIDAILGEHVWEHLTREDGALAAKHCYAYLKPGGYLRVAVPDGLHPDPAYIEKVRPGGTGMGADDHKVLYTYQTFREIFAAAGFTVELLEYFDEAGEFHCTEWRPEDGKIRRSKRFDRRNEDGTLSYTSLILDAKKNSC
jgi:predicted SAM-dependent methyltransferase